MAYKNTTIYFMSGTGNSYRVSKWLEEIAKKNGSNTKVFSAVNHKPVKNIKNGNDNLMGIVYNAVAHIKICMAFAPQKIHPCICCRHQGFIKIRTGICPGNERLRYVYRRPGIEAQRL